MASLVVLHIMIPYTFVEFHEVRFVNRAIEDKE